MEGDLLIIKALVAAKKGGMPVTSLSHEYLEIEGQTLNFRKYGFNSLSDMIRSSPGLSISSGGMISVHDEKMQHVASLVSRQKSVSKKSRNKKTYKTYSYGKNNGYQSAFNRRPSQYDSKAKSSYRPSSQTLDHSKVSRTLNQPSQPLPRRQNVSVPSSVLSSSKPVYSHKTPNSVDSCSDSSSFTEETTRQYNKPPASNPICGGVSDFKMVKSKVPVAKRTSFSLGAGDVRFKNLSSHSVSRIEEMREEPGPSHSKEVKCEEPVRHCSVSATLKSKVLKVEDSFPFKKETTVQKSSSTLPIYYSDSEDDECSPPLMGVGRGRLRHNGNMRSPGGCENSSFGNLLSKVSEPRFGGNRCSSRIASFSSRSGLCITIPNTIASVDANDDWDSYEPSICGYQLIGEDVALTIAEVALDCPINRPGDRRCGLCVEGLTIEDCVLLIKKTESISDQVLIMLGLSDALLGLSFSEMKRHMETLLELLKARNISPVLVTVPILPCLRKYPKYLSTLMAFNNWLMQLRPGLRYFWVINAADCLLDSHKQPVQRYFEFPPGEKRIEQISSEGAQALYEAIYDNLV